MEIGDISLEVSNSIAPARSNDSGAHSLDKRLLVPPPANSIHKNTAKTTYQDLDAQSQSEYEESELMSKAPSSISNLGYKKSHRKSSFWNQPKATVASSILNLTNMIIGAGILGLPAAIADTGYVFGLLLIVIFAVASMITLHLQMIAAKVLPYASYKIMSEYTIPQLRLLSDLSVGISSLGTCAAYLIVICVFRFF
jgi:hypothetical protein